MSRVVYFFGTAGDLADSSYSAADKAAMTPAPPDIYQACPVGTLTIETKVDPKKGSDIRMLVNNVNTSDISATSFDFLGQIIIVSSSRINYIKGSLGDVIICDDGA